MLYQTFATGLVGAEIILEDGRRFEVHEGDFVENLSYWNDDAWDEVTVSGRVRVIEAIAVPTPRGGTGPCYPMAPYMGKFVRPTHLVIDSSGKNAGTFDKVAIPNIRSIENVVNRWYDPDAVFVGDRSKFPLYPALGEVAGSPESAGKTVRIFPGTYGDALYITRSLELRGNGANVRLTGAISVDAPGETVVLENLTLTDDALVLVQNAARFELRNCILGKHANSVDRASVEFSGTSKVLAIIEGNHFCAEPNGLSANVLCNAELADGSSFSDNRFHQGCCAGDNVLATVPFSPDSDPTIHVSRNVCVRSGNLFHGSIADGRGGRFIFSGNEYRDTPEESGNRPHPGLFSLELHASGDGDFSGTVIEVHDNVHGDEFPVGHFLSTEAVPEASMPTTVGFETDPIQTYPLGC